MFAVRSRINKKRLSAEFLKNRTDLEHKALRAQMNPHFLFNSLNSIQRMFVEGNTDAANEVMADFSSLLRRILNNSGKSRISLKEELDTLRLYLDIERIRCDNCFDYDIVLDESVDKLNMQVPPLVIQPFAENAIWHGVLPKKSEGHIRIHLSKVLSGDFITCVVLDNGVGMDKNMSSESKGISITEQRLGTKVIFEDPDDGGTRVILQIPFT
jgi:sensor histidine kinase YesM